MKQRIFSKCRKTCEKWSVENESKTDYNVPCKSEAKTWEKALAPEDESKSVKMIESNVINLASGLAFQTIEGFGGAMTESSAYLSCPVWMRKHRIRHYRIFSDRTASCKILSACRSTAVTIPLEEYQAKSQTRSQTRIPQPSRSTATANMSLPMLKKAIEISAEPISVLMSPWSPPYQWKTAPKIAKNDAAVYGAMGMPVPEEIPQRNHGGSLKPEYYGSWAKYVVKYLQAYLDEGIPVTMLSLQNETVAATTWDSCVWTPEESKTYLKDYLYPEMKKAGLTDKIGIFIWDHNKERMIEHVLTVLDEETMDMVAGIAFHWYSGDHFEAVELMKQKYPDKTFMLSECCALHMPGRIGFGDGGFGPVNFQTPEYVDYLDAADYAHDMIGNLNAGMNRWIDWNFLVDKDGGPRHVPMGFTSGLIVDDDFHYRKPIMYHYIGHISKYIAPGAKRIGWSKYGANLDVTAAVNPDGSYVVILLNRTKEDSGCFLRVNGHIMRVDLPAETLSTVVIEK